jgi:hypothetical protein
MGADTDREAREVTHATGIRLAEETPTPADEPIWSGIPPLAMQQLWFSIQRQQWSSLVVVPAGPESLVLDFGRPLYQVARLAMGERLRLLDARGIKLNRTAPLILEMTGAAPAHPPSVEWSERALVLIESVLSQPSGIPIALAADAALLCVEMGKTSLASVRETMQIIGSQRFLGCITLSPP